MDTAPHHPEPGQDTLPTLFLSHGAPIIALAPGEAGAFMQDLGAEIVARCGRPKAILVASAHTLARVPTVMAATRHQALYDFGGFDPALRQLRYSAPGSPALASRVVGLLQAAGLPVQMQRESGLDHGIWTVLRHLFAQASIPVLPLGWPPTWAPARLYALGQALAPLAREGILVLGSGSITHDLQRAFQAATAGEGATQGAGQHHAQSTAFRDWFAQQAAAANWPALLDWQAQAPHAAQMHPSTEHLLPFFVAAGAAHAAGSENPAPAQRLHASIGWGDLGMDAYAFGSWGASSARATSC